MRFGKHAYCIVRAISHTRFLLLPALLASLLFLLFLLMMMMLFLLLLLCKIPFQKTRIDCLGQGTILSAVVSSYGCCVDYVGWCFESIIVVVVCVVAQFGHSCIHVYVLFDQDGVPTRAHCRCQTLDHVPDTSIHRWDDRKFSSSCAWQLLRIPIFTIRTTLDPTLCRRTYLPIRYICFQKIQQQQQQQQRATRCRCNWR
mmetsp:Transcript_21838/g.37146  ORF Transcript_21838/g.37146 Transcript_21838/m.37146 type:complete len:200 (+) Transcript_21838:208-807(+)